MSQTVDEAALAKTLAPHFARERVDPSCLRFVVDHLRRPDDDWRWCCGSNCDPCVVRLGRIVDAARAALGIAMPPPDAR